MNRLVKRGSPICPYRDPQLETLIRAIAATRE